ncbi:Phosphatidylinositol 3,4,5-trisphosphate 3-phosphatase and protein-tyrosine-phosphatase PTEN2A [Thalictrum thalictroides]|uniref:Phosphatidylinositol 3,4,5-trisphosphate 3-phosphatase and protein-tyrosine-phosphatase PTEN2A n=1 Tax=Thalictrum thalictroides TaxID=46969 RepID=A0A7J6XE16_THATH|nr:Phosphatidylinositol 3,4,5-trisphosphate 3-phosphatase and protein-tyrosine-phosphatase PTEN2A [Thalictrum thalictroides]
MNSESENSSASPPTKGSDVQTSAISAQEESYVKDAPSILSASGISSWAKNLKLPQPLMPAAENSQTVNDGKSNFERFTTVLGLRLSTKASKSDEIAEENSNTSETGVLESFKKGLVDSSKSAVKAVQVKARHMVSQNKRRYQEGGFDLDMTYITENIIAMGFPAGDISSGLFGYLEGFYRNHMEEVIKFFETNHKGKYKVYNLCSERLYDASLFHGKVASFPFEDHNCPPIELMLLFCQSAYSWLKEDIENVVVVHCKAGTARTGLMISSLLLFLKFLPTAEESIDHYNQKRCLDGKGLVLPSQIRYVKYFESIITHFDGKIPPDRRCMLRGFRLINCPFWIRPSITVSNHKGILFSTQKHSKTKNLMPEDFWIGSRKKEIMVFALPGEPGLTVLSGEFKIHFHDRQGDFYCWLNTTMMENRKILNTSDLDGFDKRSFPSPGFQVEVVMIDYSGNIPRRTKNERTSSESGGSLSTDTTASRSNPEKGSENQDKDDVFSDSESEESESSGKGKAQATYSAEPANNTTYPKAGPEEMAAITHGTAQISLKSGGPTEISRTKSDATSQEEVKRVDSMGVSDIKAIAADASVFSFGDEEDSESE